MSASSSISVLGGRLASFLHHKPLVDVPPVLTSPKRFPYGQFQFQLEIPRPGAYEIEASTDLRHWTILSSDLSRVTRVEYLDTTAGNFSFRFYRAWFGELCSPNVLGYAALTIPPGFAMIANPLIASDNTVQALFPHVPNGATLTKFDTHLFKLTRNSFSNGKWSNPGDTLVPGEGAIILNPSFDFKKVSMVGEVQQGDLSLPIPAGFSVRSSIVPVPGQLDADLLFPAADDDVVHLFDRDRQQYVIYSFKESKWSPEPPVLAVGESFWVGKTFGGNWNRTLVLNQTEPVSASEPASPTS